MQLKTTSENMLVGFLNDEQGVLYSALIEQMRLIEWYIRDPREEERKLLNGCLAEETRTPEQMIADAQKAHRAYVDIFPTSRPVLFSQEEEIGCYLPALQRVAKRRAEIAAYRERMAALVTQVNYEL